MHLMMQMDIEMDVAIYFFFHSNLYLIIVTNLFPLFQHIYSLKYVYILNVLYDSLPLYGNYVYYLVDIYMIFFFLYLLVNLWYIDFSSDLSFHLSLEFEILV